MQFLGTHISTGHNNQPVCYATVKEAGAALPYDLEINEYIALLHTEIINIDAGAKLLHSLATGGESKLLKDWQDEPVTDPADVSKYFNGIPATASKTWRERHLNEGGDR